MKPNMPTMGLSAPGHLAWKKFGLVEWRECTRTWIHNQMADRPDPTVVQLLELVDQLPLSPRIERRLTMRLGFRERTGCVFEVGDPDALAALERATDARLSNVLDRANRPPDDAGPEVHGRQPAGHHDLADDDQPEGWTCSRSP